MASLSGGYGNVGASALVKTAASIATQITDYQDKLQALTWSASGQTPSDWAAYQEYLTKRVSNLQSTGTLANASKALSLTSTLQSANRSFTSNQIQQSSINILEGTGSPVDKQNAIISFYNQAQANGDQNLAQNLRQQYDSLNQQIQYQAQTAATANETLAKTNATLEFGNNVNAAQALESGLKQLSNEYSRGGQASMDAAIKDFVTTYGPTYKAITGKDLPAGKFPNMAAIAQGVSNAVGLYYAHASDATALTDPTQSQTYALKAQDIKNGVTLFATPYGNKSMQELARIAVNPNFHEVQTTNSDGTVSYSQDQASYKGLTYTNDPITGQPMVTSVPNGDAGTPYSQMTKDQQAQVNDQLKKLGFSTADTNNGAFKDKNGNVQVKLSDATNKWFDPKSLGLTKGETLTLIPTANGYQFQTPNGIHHIALDAKGLGAIYSIDPNGTSKMVHGQYGFNPTANTLVQNANVQQLQQKAVDAANAAIAAKQKPVTNAIQNGSIKSTPLPGATFAPKTTSPLPTAYIAPSSIKPGTTLSTQERTQADAAINALLGANPQTQQATYRAISASAGYGNPYDQYKLTQLNTKIPSLASTQSGLTSNGTIPVSF